MATIADEREHRRGLVLGLTLAEALLLLIFLLLLALAARIFNLQKAANDATDKYISLRTTVENLKPIQEELSKRGGLSINSVNDLVDKLNRVESLQSQLSNLKRE